MGTEEEWNNAEESLKTGFVLDFFF